MDSATGRLGRTRRQSWPGDLLVGWEASREAGITRRRMPQHRGEPLRCFSGRYDPVGNLTVNLGARFDYQQGKNLPSAVPANPVFPELLPAVVYPGDTGYPITWRMVQPRVGATTLSTTPHSDSRVVFAIYRPAGHLSDQLRSTPFRISRSSTIVGSTRTVMAASNRASSPGHCPPVPPGSTRIIRPPPYRSIRSRASLEPPMTDEFIVGIERQITSDLIGLSSVYVSHYSQPGIRSADRHDAGGLPVSRQRDGDRRGAETVSS